MEAANKAKGVSLKYGSLKSCRLQAFNFTKTKLFHKYFSKILLSNELIFFDFLRFRK